MAVKFIHIGMMKTASTYMQNVWLRDSQFALANQGAAPVVDYLRKSTLENTFDPGFAMEIQLDKQPVDSDDIIISSEGFTCAYLTGKEPSPTRQYLRNTSELLGSLRSETNNILLCVRSPVAWIRSMHAQFINEGRFGNGESFMKLKEGFLKECLDLDFIINAFGERFDNILVLPVEYLYNKEEDFWARIADRFSVAMPAVKVPPMNESVKGIRLPLMSHLNETANRIRGALSTSDVYKNNERDMLVKNSQQTSLWFNRRFCQFATDAQIESMCKHVQLKTDPEAFRKMPVSDELADHLLKQFVEPMEALTGDRSLADSYRRDIEHAVSSSQ